MSERDMRLRVGIGKAVFEYPSRAQTPWYVTIYNRAFTQDRAQMWFETHAEATDYARKMLPIWRKRFAE